MTEESQIRVDPPHAPCYPDLRGKVAIVTGGGSGIGRAMCIRFALEGMQILFCGRTGETLAQTQSLVESVGGRGEYRVTDLSVEDDVEAFLDWTREKAGRMDLMVHNAADMRSRRWQKLDMDKWRQTLATNAGAAFQLSKRAAEVMTEQGSGSIILVSTIGAIRAHYNMWAYDASKGAIEALVRAMAVELAHRGIRVNSLAPGATMPIEGLTIPNETERMMAQMGFASVVLPERNVQEFVPMRRWATPAEIAAAAAFLASSQASYITGHTLVADGGAIAQISPRQARI